MRTMSDNSLLYQVITHNKDHKKEKKGVYSS